MGFVSPANLRYCAKVAKQFLEAKKTTSSEVVTAKDGVLCNWCCGWIKGGETALTVRATGHYPFRFCKDECLRRREASYHRDIDRAHKMGLHIAT